jgi:hypothetical protein
MRTLILATLILAAGACRPYQKEQYLADPDGLLEADRYAQYGPEQAQAIAIGRELGGDHGMDRAAQIARATEFARAQPDVVDIVPDSIGLRLQVRFKSGWVKGIVPINDGKHGAETMNLPGVSAPQRP